VGLSERASAFVDEPGEDEAAGSDSLPDLLRLHDAISKLYRELAARPHRAETAAGLLSELWSETDRLLRRVGEESLARALRLREAAAGGGDDTFQSASGAARALDASTTSIDAPATVSENEVREWLARYRERSVAPQVSFAVLLHALLDRIGPPPEELGPDAREIEIERLESGASDETLRELRQLPNELQRSYLRLLTARLNAVRAVVGGEALARERVGRLLGAIRDYTREHRPGAVYGLSRDHEPKGGTWEADAHHMWHRLARDDDAPVSKKSIVVRSAPRSIEPEADDADERESPGPEPEWPLWGFVRDRTVLMVGGAPRESARARVEKAFAMRELVWSPDDPRKAQNAEARIASRGYDLVVVLLRFMSHATNEKLAHACAARGVAFVPVEHGYGVASIRRSMDRFLAPRASASAGK
jgi:hypothetical protein